MQKLPQTLDLLIIGGGAAGFFGGIQFLAQNPNSQVCLLEASNEFLSKVRVSGGGRCNVTHSEFDPKILASFYPRGSKELLGPFHRFQPGDTIVWFAEKGIDLKVEEDGRMFPVSNTSETIVNCFLKEAQEKGLQLRKQSRVVGLQFVENAWELTLQDGQTLRAPQVLLAAGSSKSIWKLLGEIGVDIVEPNPSLFSFVFEPDPWFEGLAGNTLENMGVSVKLPGFAMYEEGPVVFTHKGLSGPGILKLSAWGARVFSKLQYRFPIHINWLPNWDWAEFERELHSMPDARKVVAHGCFGIPKRTWINLLTKGGYSQLDFHQLKGKKGKSLFAFLTHFPVQVKGKSTHKEEFVTAGGIALEQVHFKTMELKGFPGMFAAGEILNIDALTGGFNFQAAWTTSWIAAENMTRNA